MKEATQMQPEPAPLGLQLIAGQLFESADAFTRLLAEKPIGKPRLAYNLARTFREFRSELEELLKQRVEILKAHGGVEANGMVTLPRENHTPEFKAAMAELLAIPLTIWGHRITLDELEAAQISLSAADMILLDWLIE